MSNSFYYTLTTTYQIGWPWLQIWYIHNANNTKCGWICADDTCHNRLQDKIERIGSRSLVKHSQFLFQCLVDDTIIQTHARFSEVRFLPGKQNGHLFSSHYSCLQYTIDQFMKNRFYIFNLLLDTLCYWGSLDGCVSWPGWCVHGRAQEKVVKVSNRMIQTTKIKLIAPTGFLSCIHWQNSVLNIN